MGAISIDANWSLMTPEIVLAVLALVVFTLDFMTGIKGRKPFLAKISVFSLLVTAVLVFVTNRFYASIGDMFIIDPFAMVFKIIILVSVALVILMSMHYLEKNLDLYQGEYYSLMLFSALGGMLMVSSADLVTLYIGLEIVSIASYALVGFKKHNHKSTESAIKYVILGGASSAFILYGMSFLFGLTGTTSVAEIGQAMPALFAEYPYLVMMSLLFMLAGLGFKISVVPFHMWAPDVYEGAPTPVTAFLSVVSKIAAFAVVLRVFIMAFGSIFEEWTLLLAIVAAVTMLAGNLIALTQKNIKRLMAYSGIAQAGYLLVALATTAQNPNATVNIVAFYSVAYLLMVLGAFAVITVVTENTKSVNKEDIRSFNGLYKRSPFLAIAMTVFLVSLAGLPFTAGFVGKANIFFGAIKGGMLWLAVLMFATSIISFFYYFGIIRQMFSVEPNPNEEEELKVPRSISAVVMFGMVLTVLLGVLPGLLTNIFAKFQWMAMFIM